MSQTAQYGLLSPSHNGKPLFCALALPDRYLKCGGKRASIAMGRISQPWQIVLLQ